MSVSFKELGISQRLVAALAVEQITVPTPIQALVIPEAIKHRDIIVQSQTGTGKTLAFLLPLFEKLQPIREMQALVLVPTHELAVQILRQVERLSQNSDKALTGAVIIGNVNIERQVLKLRDKPQIIIGTAGRVLQLIGKKKISAHTIKTIIVDEADRLFDAKNSKSINDVIKTTPRDRQMVLVSATISPRTIETTKSIMKNPQFLKADTTPNIPSTIEHRFTTTTYENKIDRLRKLIFHTKAAKSLVFANTAKEIKKIVSELKYHGVKVASLHGEDNKMDRKATMEKYRTGKLSALIASDIAARGLDIKDVTHVFNVDMPDTVDGYLHRVGRTGRNGKAGVAISIVTSQERAVLQKHEKALGLIFEEIRDSR
ncbi:DEAD/DEAH box helicase [bacterium]|nr:DEAD/DEAH box helicase [bacterium]